MLRHRRLGTMAARPARGGSPPDPPIPPGGSAGRTGEEITEFEQALRRLASDSSIIFSQLQELRGRAIWNMLAALEVATAHCPEESNVTEMVTRLLQSKYQGGTEYDLFGALTEAANSLPASVYEGITAVTACLLWTAAGEILSGHMWQCVGLRDRMYSPFGYVAPDLDGSGVSRSVAPEHLIDALCALLKPYVDFRAIDHMVERLFMLVGHGMRRHPLGSVLEQIGAPTEMVEMSDCFEGVRLSVPARHYARTAAIATSDEARIRAFFHAAIRCLVDGDSDVTFGLLLRAEEAISAAPPTYPAASRQAWLRSITYVRENMPLVAGLLREALRICDVREKIWREIHLRGNDR